MSNLAPIFYSVFKVREVPLLCKCYECNKARSRATSLGLYISLRNLRVFAQLDEQRRVVALEGTGGIADLLSAAARGEHVDDRRVVQCLASGLIRTIPLDAVDEVKELLGVVTSP